MAATAETIDDAFQFAQVRRLDDTIVNQIAAGEVIERPASVIKELVENAIDAGATSIEIVIANGGKTLMRVTDNGQGMTPDNLELAVERHCTSKLSDDLFDIRSLGFRGEALPSVGSVSRLSITSRAKKADEAWKIEVDGGRIRGPVPAALQGGTVVEVRDLFFATPARLKFLKSDQAENNAITDIFKRIALAFPDIRFQISGEGRSVLDYRATDAKGRIAQVLGREFEENSIAISAERNGVLLEGFASIPTWHRGNSLQQYFFVNGRPVRDKALLGALRGAYFDFLPSGRYPSCALFIEIEPRLVDVNVHPAKADVRFRDPGLIRGLIVGALKQALSGGGPMTSQAGSEAMMAAFKTPETTGSGNSGFAQAGFEQAGMSQAGFNGGHHIARSGPNGFSGWASPGANPASNTGTSSGAGFSESQASFDHTPSGAVANITADEPLQDYPLGSARAQLHENYIVAQTTDGLVIVDQHAAHERIVYEKLKAGFENGLPAQLLLVPDIIDLPQEDVSRLSDAAGELEKLGLELEAFGPGAVAVRATPALLGEVDAKKLVRDLADEISDWGSADTLKDRLEAVAATIACHGSVRSGRVLKPEEMNALLRQMEATPNSGQCNHGRPTFIKLDLKDIERQFGR